MQSTRQFYSTFLILFFCFPLFSAGIKGIITDSKGQPVPYATIYVKELGTGTTANIEGKYVYRLSAGTYNITFQSIGYESVVSRIKIDNGFVETNVVLKEQTYELKQVEVTSDGRDPAYTIMRKTIAKAKFHTNQLNSYKAQVYMKGTGRLIDSPFFLRKAIKKEGIDSSFAFTSESVSEIFYKRPNYYEEKVISVYTQGNDNDTSPNAYINASFYEPDMEGAISPLSPKAFAYYQFIYEGFFVDRGYEVDKIKVIPRSKGDNVFEGTINIVDGQWSIHSLDLTTYKLGIGINIKQVFAPIEEKAWLPISHQFKVTGKFFGFKFEGSYLASVSDYKIEINPDLEYEMEVIDEAVETELAKQIEKNSKVKTTDIEKRLSEGKEVTRKELKKMLRDYEKEEQKKEKEPKVEEIVKYSVDSLATKRDSLYWEKIRPIPLTKLEIRGYKVTDSLAVVEKEEARKDSLGIRKNKKGTGFGIGDLFFGGSYGKTKEKRFYIKPSVNTLQFNTVEGYNFQYGFGYRQNFKNSNRWFIEGKARYGFSRKELNYHFVTGVDFNRKKASSKAQVGSEGEVVNKYRDIGRLRLSGGKYIYQYNSDNPIHPLVNSITTLLSEHNFIKLYEKQFVKGSYYKRINREWSFQSALEWSERSVLQNTTSHVFFNKDNREYTPNIPFNFETSADFATHQATIASIGLRGKPWQKYRIRNGRKSAISHSSPTISIDIQQGFYDKNIANQSNTNFTHFEAGFQHHFNVGYRGKMDVKFKIGAFANNENLQFLDYKHFLGNQTIFSTTDPVGSFRLLDYYAYSTKGFYATVHAHYQFRKLLATQFLELQFLGIKENVFVNYLNTDYSQNYFELGYSIDYIARIFRLEFVTSFQDFKYQDFGISTYTD